MDTVTYLFGLLIGEPGAISQTRPMSSFDPTAPGFLADPYPALAALREETPLFYEESLARWFVTRHADVRACLRDRRLGRNFRHVGSEKDFGAEPLDPRLQVFWDTERWSLLWLEPPEHTRIRKLVAAAFTPRSVESLRAPAEDLARTLLEPHLERGRLELLRDYAQPYSIAVICRLLGVSTDRQQELLDWSHAMVKMYEFDTTEEQAAAAARAAGEFRDYVLELIDTRRREPREDMVTALVQARVDGEGLSDAEIVSTIIVLLNAGHEATVNTLGNGIRALLRHPDGVQVAGKPVPRGEKLSLLFGSANRDPRVFAEPERFDVARANAAEHIGFGGGIHVCIGAPLARLELEASLRALVERAPGLELRAEPKRNPAFVIWGLEAVELTV